MFVNVIRTQVRIFCTSYPVCPRQMRLHIPKGGDSVWNRWEGTHKRMHTGALQVVSFLFFFSSGVIFLFFLSFSVPLNARHTCTPFRKDINVWASCEHVRRCCSPGRTLTNLSKPCWTKLLNTVTTLHVCSKRAKNQHTSK